MEFLNPRRFLCGSANFHIAQGGHGSAVTAGEAQGFGPKGTRGAQGKVDVGGIAGSTDSPNHSTRGSQCPDLLGKNQIRLNIVGESGGKRQASRQ